MRGPAVSDPMTDAMSEDAVCLALLAAGALSVRDVDAGEEPFLYSSGNHGPGYVMVKALVARQAVFRALIDALAAKLIDAGVPFDHVIGNATGGMIPAYALREAYQRRSGRTDVEYVYVRGARKEGGHRELVTGLEHIAPRTQAGAPSSWLVVEDMVNFAETPVNSLLLLRSLGFVAREAAAILHVDQPEGNRRLRAHDVRLTTLTSMPRLLDVAVREGYAGRSAVEGYRAYLEDPGGWQRARGLGG